MQSLRKPAARVGLGAPRSRATAERAKAEAPRLVFAGTVVEVLKDDRVAFVTTGGRRVLCRCPLHVDPGWLRVALGLGPVAAEAALPTEGVGTVWCLLPTAAQRKVVVDTLSLSASASVEIACGKSKLQLKKDGTLRLRGRDVFARGSRVTRIQGGTVRLN
jgi:hypothetical protein